MPDSRDVRPDPEIESFAVNGRSGTAHVGPGESVHISWQARHADRVRLEIRNDAGELLHAVGDAAEAGAFEYENTRVELTTLLRVQLFAEGKQPLNVGAERRVWIQRPPNLRIEGMEVTQGIQFYRSHLHLTDVDDQEPDNAVALVAHRTTWVRVYLRSGQDAGFDRGELPEVDGRLAVQRSADGSWTNVAVLSPVNPGVVAKAFRDYRDERESLRATLNFVLDPEIVEGALRLRAAVHTPLARSGNGSAVRELHVKATQRKTLKLKLIGVGYLDREASGHAGVSGIVPTPLTTLISKSVACWRRFPVADRLEYERLTSVVVDEPISFGALLALTTALRAADGPEPDWIYCTIVAPGVPVVPSPNRGGGDDGWAVVLVAEDGILLAHEVGHALGLPHAPGCGAEVAPDSRYPAYEPYDPPDTPMGSIGEFGFILDGPQVVPPLYRFGTDHPKDIMTYCYQRWISPWHYRAALRSPRLEGPTASAADTSLLSRRGREDFRERLTVCGFIDERGAIEIGHLLRGAAAEPDRDWQPTQWLAEAIDRDGERVAQASVYRSGASAQAQHECGATLALMAVLEDGGRAAEVRISEGQQTLWSRKKGALDPAIEAFAADIEGETVRLRWKLVTDGPLDPVVWVQTSAGAQSGWRTVTVCYARNGAALPQEALAEGRTVLRALVHDGFSTSASEAVELLLPPRAPQAVILHPSPGRPVVAGDPVNLRGLATDGFRALAHDAVALNWSIDGREVARGREVWIGGLDVGDHELELTAVRPGQGSAKTALTLTVTADDRDPRLTALEI